MRAAPFPGSETAPGAASSKPSTLRATDDFHLTRSLARIWDPRHRATPGSCERGRNCRHGVRSGFPSVPPTASRPVLLGPGSRTSLGSTRSIPPCLSGGSGGSNRHPVAPGPSFQRLDGRRTSCVNAVAVADTDLARGQPVSGRARTCIGIGSPCAADPGHHGFTAVLQTTSRSGAAEKLLITVESGGGAVPLGYAASSARCRVGA